MSISMESWETKSLLLNHVSQCVPNVVVGSATEAPRGFYSYAVESGNCPILIGVIANQSKAPCALFLPASRRVALGYDQSVALIDCQSATLRETTLLDGVFFEFLKDEERAQVLVLHELGVVAFSEHGEVLWRYTTGDILEDWRMVNARLVLTLMDTNAPVELSLDDGIPLSSPPTPDSPSSPSRSS